MIMWILKLYQGSEFLQMPSRSVLFHQRAFVEMFHGHFSLKHILSTLLCFIETCFGNCIVVTTKYFSLYGFYYWIDLSRWRFREMLFVGRGKLCFKQTVLSAVTPCYHLGNINIISSSSVRRQEFGKLGYKIAMRPISRGAQTACVHCRGR